jgi:hypothetical protein
LRVELDSRSVKRAGRELERELSSLDALAAGGRGGSTASSKGDVGGILEDDLKLSRERNDLLRQIVENTDQDFTGVGGFDVPTPKPRTPGRRGGFGGVGGFGIGALAIADALKQDPVDTQQTSEGPVLPPNEIIGPIQTGEGDTPGRPASALTGSGSARPDAGRDIPGLPDISGGPGLSELTGGVLAGGALAALGGLMKGAAARSVGGLMKGAAARSIGGGVAISRGRFERGLQNVEQFTAGVGNVIDNQGPLDLSGGGGPIYTGPDPLGLRDSNEDLIDLGGGGGPIYTGPDPLGLGGGGESSGSNDKNRARERSAKSMNTTISPTVNVQGTSERRVEEIVSREVEKAAENIKNELKGLTNGF